MKRSALAAALLVALAVPGAAPAKRHSDVMESARFAIVASGATVMDGGGTRLLLDLEDGPKTQYTFGSGAASLFVVPTADGSQKATGHAYYEQRSLRLRIAYTVAPADADNVSAITGTGTLRGSGRVRGAF